MITYVYYNPDNIGKIPAIRLITPENQQQPQPQPQSQGDLGSPRKDHKEDEFRELTRGDLKHLAVAGRLDEASSGLLVFTQNGLLATRLLQTHRTPTHQQPASLTPLTQPRDNQTVTEGSEIEKEYIVKVQVAPKGKSAHYQNKENQRNKKIQTFKRARALEVGEHEEASVTRGDQASERTEEHEAGLPVMRFTDLFAKGLGKNMERPKSPRTRDMPKLLEWLTGRDMALDAQRLLPVHVSLIDAPLEPSQHGKDPEEIQLRFVLREGKKRQIRRMCSLVGLSVTELHRVRIGKVVLGGLKPGQWRFLGSHEIF